MDNNICKGITKKNEKCKKKVNNENKYCHLHSEIFIKKTNDNEKKDNVLKLFPNEIIENIYEFLDLQSKINFSRTCKIYHIIFKYNAYNINMEDIIILMIRNRMKTTNNDFKSIYYLILYYIEKNGIHVDGYFNLTGHSYTLNININNSVLKIEQTHIGILIKINNEVLGYIDSDKYKIRDIINIIYIIYDNFKNNDGHDINNILNIMKNININIKKFDDIYNKCKNKDLYNKIIKEDLSKHKSIYYLTKKKQI